MKKRCSFILVLLLCVFLPVIALAEESPESITDSLTEDMGNFTPYGGMWIYKDGTYNQTDDMVSGNSWNYGSYFQYAYADFTVEFEMKLNSVGDDEGFAGIMFRKAKPDDTMEMSGYGVILKSYGQIAIYDWSKAKVMFQLPVSDAYAWHMYKIENVGKNIKLYIDGEIRQSISDSSYSEGFISLTTGTGAASFRNFKVTGDSIGTAATIGVISDGGVDMETADNIFAERATVGETETADEPAWFTTMITKLDDKNGSDSGDDIAMSGSDGGKTLMIVTLVIAGLLLITVIGLVLFGRKGGQKGKGMTATAILLAAFLTVSSIPMSSWAEEEGDVFDESAYDKVFYVASDGDDGNPGTTAAPFKTIRKAKEAVREVNVSQHKDIAVVLREGRYTIGNTLVFDENDSGKNGCNVLYMSYPGDLVFLSGGMKITGWQEAGEGVWKAKTSLDHMRQLYIDDVRALLARSSIVPSEMYNFDRESGAFIVSTEDVGEVTSGEICTYMDWNFNISPIKSVDSIPDNPYAKEIKLVDFAAKMMVTQTGSDLLDYQSKFFLQNSKVLLDEPGEFWFDEAENTVYYIPREGQDMETAAVYAPAVESLVKIQGSDPMAHAQNLIFEGIVFEYSGFNTLIDKGLKEYQANHFFVEDDGTDYPPMNVPSATIHVENADNIRIERCVVRHSGGCGINLYPSVNNSVIDGNFVTDISGNGVTISPFCTNKYTSQELYTPSDPELTGVYKIAVTNNVITWIGQEFRAACGLANILGFEIVMRSNEVAYVPCIGISNGWGWSTREYAVKENTIAYNDIHHVAMSTMDVAGYYNLNAQQGTQIRGNYIHDIQISGMGRYGAPVYAIYLDEGSNHLVVTENSVVNCPDGQEDILFHNTGGNIYTLGNDFSEDVALKAGVGQAYKSISLRNYEKESVSLIENVSLGQPGAPFDGEVGMKFTAEKDVKVTTLGRFYYMGNTGVHKLTLYNAESGKVVAEVPVDMSKGKADYNGFKYAVLSGPVNLTAGESYYLTTEEKTDGDWWLEETCRVIPSEVFVVEGNAIKTAEGFTSPSKPGEDHTAGPVNLLFEE